MKRLQQILLNLFSNALKFTERAGTVVIMVEKLAQQAKEVIRISVIDTGIGIKEQDQSKIFTLFSSMRDKTREINMQGIGLGLVISQMIVKKFNGQIDFISEF